MQNFLEPLRSFWNGAVFTAFDTETTGLKPEFHNVIEIGAVRFDKSGVIARYNVLIKPPKPVPAEITKINNISNQMLENMPGFSQRAGDFLRFIQGSYLIAHNAPFDVSFINAELKRCNLPNLQNEILDTVVISRQAFPQFPKFNLQFLAQNLNINVKNAHRAEDDARVCMELFIKIVEKLCPKPNINTNIEER